jgi:hypothetical protein
MPVSLSRIPDFRRHIRAADCGNLELASDDLHDRIGGVVTVPGSHRPFGCDDSSGKFIQAQQLPSDGLIAAAAASDLPDTHDGVVVVGEADGVNLDIPGVAVIPKLENVP